MIHEMSHITHVNMSHMRLYDKYNSSIIYSVVIILLVSWKKYLELFDILKYIYLKKMI